MGRRGRGMVEIHSNPREADPAWADIFGASVSPASGIVAQIAQLVEQRIRNA